MDKIQFKTILLDRLEKNGFTTQHNDDILMVNKNDLDFQMCMNEMYEGVEMHGYSFFDGLLEHLIEAVEFEENKTKNEQ